VGNINKGLTCLLLIGSAASSLISFTAHADGNGVIVLNREVQPIPIGRNGGKDPDPTTVNANPSVTVNAATAHAELSDNEFAGIASGSSIANSVNNAFGGSAVNTLNGINNGMPGAGGGSGNGGGMGSSISNTVNRAVSNGLAPLGALGGAMK
jgi:hypothetical protein